MAQSLVTTSTDVAELRRSVDRLSVLLGLSRTVASELDVIFSYEGTLDKFIGDAIMAVFGTPVAHEDDSLRDVKAGVDMRRALVTFNSERVAASKQPIEIGVGICNGAAVFGGIGSEERMEFTVIGDTVNTASRLEGLTKQFPLHKIVVNEAVYNEVKDHLPCAFLIEEKVKGKTKPVRVYGVSEQFVHSSTQLLSRQ